MSEFDQLMKAFQQQDAKLNKLMRAFQQRDAKLNKLLRALPEIAASARLLLDLANAPSPPKIDRGKRKRGRPPKENGKDHGDSRSFETRLAKAKQINDRPKLMSVPEAAAVIRVGRSKMWQLVWHREVKSVFVGRQRRVVAASLDQYIKSLQGRA
jgi:excisionase family DNA binding protein